MAEVATRHSPTGRLAGTLWAWLSGSHRERPPKRPMKPEPPKPQLAPAKRFFVRHCKCARCARSCRLPARATQRCARGTGRHVRATRRHTLKCQRQARANRHNARDSGHSTLAYRRAALAGTTAGKSSQRCARPPTSSPFSYFANDSFLPSFVVIRSTWRRRRQVGDELASGHLFSNST